MRDAHMDWTEDELKNVFEHFDPVLPEAYRRAKFVFLANGSPIVQMKVLDQMTSPKLTVADTMDLWINIQRDGKMIHPGFTAKHNGFI